MEHYKFNSNKYWLLVIDIFENCMDWIFFYNQLVLGTNSSSYQTQVGATKLVWAWYRQTTK